MTPEYLHALTNHLPIIGLPIGGALLLAALLRGSGELRAAALVVVALAGLSVWPIAESGEHGFDRVYSMSNADGQAWLKEHQKRAEKSEPVFYLTAALAVAALLAALKKPALAKPLAIAALLGVVASVGLVGWVAKAGGQIRHPEFRSGPP